MFSRGVTRKQVSLLEAQADSLENEFIHTSNANDDDLKKMVFVLDELEKSSTNLHRRFWESSTKQTSLQRSGGIGSRAYTDALNEKIEKLRQVLLTHVNEGEKLPDTFFENSPIESLKKAQEAVESKNEGVVNAENTSVNNTRINELKNAQIKKVTIILSEGDLPKLAGRTVEQLEQLKTQLESIESTYSTNAPIWYKGRSEKISSLLEKVNNLIVAKPKQTADLMKEVSNLLSEKQYKNESQINKINSLYQELAYRSARIETHKDEKSVSLKEEITIGALGRYLKEIDIKR